MKKLALVALALASMGLAGCVVESGTMLADWTIVAPQGATCDQVNATHVEILTTRMGSTIGLADITRCQGQNSSTAETSELDLGDYTVQVSLINAGADIGSDLDDIVIDTFPSETTQIFEDGQVVMLGQYNFEAAAPAPADATFRADYGAVGTAQGSNCETTANGGNGVVQQETILKKDGTPIMKMYTGVDQAMMQFSGTTGGTAVLCMDNAVVQTLQDLDAGNYEIEVHGLKGGTGMMTHLCYSGTKTFTVTAGTNLDVGDVNAPFVGTAIPECNAKPGGRR